MNGDLRAFTGMYHVELRQFPHVFCRFNLTEHELRGTILDAWVRGEGIELGERNWSPQRANLTVLEGPQLPLEQLSMGRGWRSAVRHSEDVTERVIAAVRNVVEGSTGSEPAPSATVVEEQLAVGSLELAEKLLALLGDDPVPLLRAWLLALERHPDRPPSECLALAEALVRR